MNIIPAIDILDAKVVRLTQGQFERSQAYSEDPLAVALGYQRSGAKWLHVVDLSGAKDTNNRQLKLIEEISKNTQLNIQVGGGIRSEKDIEKLLEIGVNRVIVGTAAIKDPEEVLRWKNKLGEENILISLDVRLIASSYKMMISGWREESAWMLTEYLEKYQPTQILCTDINSDGMLSGPNVKLYVDLLKQFPNLSIQASGGVSNLEDIQRLKLSGLRDCIIGKALFESQFTLQQAIEVTDAS